MRGRSDETGGKSVEKQRGSAQIFKEMQFIANIAHSSPECRDRLSSSASASSCLGFRGIRHAETKKVDRHQGSVESDQESKNQSVQFDSDGRWKCSEEEKGRGGKKKSHVGQRRRGGLGESAVWKTGRGKKGTINVPCQIWERGSRDVKCGEVWRDLGRKGVTG